MKFQFTGKARIGLLILSLCLGFTACEKKEVIKPDQEELPGNGVPFEGEPTAVGTPTGDKISQSIGAGGGVIRTADGKVSLTIPAGALSQPTTISLQPIENKAFLGIGSAYEFSPDGLKFAKPAQLTVQYEAGSLAGTSPEAIGIAFQDAKHAWQGTAAKVNVDEGTFTASVPHFSSWAFFKYYSLTPESMNLAPSKVLKLEVVYLKGSVHDPDHRNLPPSADDNDLIAPLILPKLLKADQVKNWRVNGEDPGNQFNEMTGGLTLLDLGAAAEYKAPSKVPAKPYNPIAISVELKSRKGQLILVSNLTIAAENEITIGSKRIENPITEAHYFGEFLNVLMTDKRPGQGDFASAGISIDGVNGRGTFPLSETCNIAASVSQQEEMYYGYWEDEEGNTKYGPGSVTITEFGGKGETVAGKFSATLHYQSQDRKVHKTITVTGVFKTSVDQ